MLLGGNALCSVFGKRETSREEGTPIYGDVMIYEDLDCHITPDSDRNNGNQTDRDSATRWNEAYFFAMLPAYDTLGRPITLAPEYRFVVDGITYQTKSVTLRRGLLGGEYWDVRLVAVTNK